MNTIELFMWAYQSQFQIEANVAAKRLFDKLSENLAPKVILVGFLEKARSDRHAICLEPEDSGYEPQTFAMVRERAKYWQSNDAETQLVNSDPTIQAGRLRRAAVKALQIAIQEAVRREDEQRG